MSDGSVALRAVEHDGIRVLVPSASSRPPVAKSKPSSPFETLDPKRQKYLTDRPLIGSRYAWVNFAKRVDALDRTSASIYKTVRDFFHDQAQRFAHTVHSFTPPKKADITEAISHAMENFDWTPWERLLRPQLQPLVQRAFEDGAHDMWDALHMAGIDLRWDLVAPLAQDWAENRAAELVGMHVEAEGKVVPTEVPGWSLTETARDAMRRDLTEWLHSGLSWTDIGQRLQQNTYGTAMPDWRARMIARTETAWAYNMGNLASILHAGIQGVRVFDGTEFDEPCRKADGESWTMEQAAANPLQHPHCARTFVADMHAMQKDLGRALAHVVEEFGHGYDPYRVSPGQPGGGEFAPGPHADRPDDDDDHVDSAPGMSAANPIHTSDVLVAAQAIQEGRYVELSQPDEVSTLLDKLAEIADEAAAKGEKAPTYDLCKVSVPGTNLFCAESKGIHRVDMPQLSGKPIAGSPAAKMPTNAKGEVDLSESFATYLATLGHKVVETKVEASHLRASQDELNGAKVAGMVEAAKAAKFDPSKGLIWVSRDNYVIDGHHRWAAVVGLEYEENKRLAMPVRRVDMGIVEILALAKAYAKKMGLPQADVSKSKVAKDLGHAIIHTAEAIASAAESAGDPYHVPKGMPGAGQFTTGPHDVDDAPWQPHTLDGTLAAHISGEKWTGNIKGLRHHLVAEHGLKAGKIGTKQILLDMHGHDHTHPVAAVKPEGVGANAHHHDTAVAPGSPEAAHIKAMHGAKPYPHTHEKQVQTVEPKKAPLVSEPEMDSHLVSMHGYDHGQEIGAHAFDHAETTPPPGMTPHVHVDSEDVANEPKPPAFDMTEHLLEGHGVAAPEGELEQDMLHDDLHHGTPAEQAAWFASHPDATPHTHDEATGAVIPAPNGLILDAEGKPDAPDFNQLSGPGVSMKERADFVAYLNANNWTMYHATSAENAKRIQKEGLLSPAALGEPEPTSDELDEIEETGPYIWGGVWVGSKERAMTFLDPGGVLLAVDMHGMQNRVEEFSGLGQFANDDDTQASIGGSIHPERIGVVNPADVPATVIPKHSTPADADMVDTPEDVAAKKNVVPMPSGVDALVTHLNAMHGGHVTAEDVAEQEADSGMPIHAGAHKFGFNGEPGEVPHVHPSPEQQDAMDAAAEPSFEDVASEEADMQAAGMAQPSDDEVQPDLNDMPEAAGGHGEELGTVDATHEHLAHDHWTGPGLAKHLHDEHGLSVKGEDQEKWDQVAELDAQGLSASAISKKTGLPGSSIYHFTHPSAAYMAKLHALHAPEHGEEPEVYVAKPGVKKPKGAKKAIESKALPPGAFGPWAAKDNTHAKSFITAVNKLAVPSTYTTSMSASQQKDAICKQIRDRLLDNPTWVKWLHQDQRYKVRTFGDVGSGHYAILDTSTGDWFVLPSAGYHTYTGDKATIEAKAAELNAKATGAADAGDVQRTYSLVNSWIAQWAQTSFSTHPSSIVMQKAAIDEFHLGPGALSAYNHRTHALDAGTQSQIEALDQKNGAAYRLFLRAMYDNTQAALDAQGWGPDDRVGVYRGMGYPTAKLPAGIKSGTRIRAPIELQPMSAFSSSRAIAFNFGGSGNWGDSTAVMLRGSVPRDRIIGTCVTGYGCLNEKEWVVLGGSGEVEVEVGKYSTTNIVDLTSSSDPMAAAEAAAAKFEKTYGMTPEAYHAAFNAFDAIPTGAGAGSERMKARDALMASLKKKPPASLKSWDYSSWLAKLSVQAHDIMKLKANSEQIAVQKPVDVPDVPKPPAVKPLVPPAVALEAAAHAAPKAPVAVPAPSPAPAITVPSTFKNVYGLDPYRFAAEYRYVQSLPVGSPERNKAGAALAAKMPKLGTTKLYSVWGQAQPLLSASGFQMEFGMTPESFLVQYEGAKAAGNLASLAQSFGVSLEALEHLAGTAKKVSGQA